MKKILTWSLAVCLIFSFTACSNQKPSEESKKSEQTEVVETELEEENTESGGFNKNATITETVLVDEGGVKITATDLKYTDYSVEVNLNIENNSGKKLSFTSGTLGYCCNSVNGQMINDGYMNSDVLNGKQAKESISISYDTLSFNGINELADIEIGIEATDEDYNDIYYGPRQIKTTAYDQYDYSKNYYQSAINSRENKKKYDYDVKSFSDDIKYDADGLKLLSSTVVENVDGETILFLELENTTDHLVDVTTNDISVNGLKIRNGGWSSDTINPGKRGIVGVEFSNLLSSKYLDVYGLKEIGTINLTLGQRDSEWNEIADAAPVDIVVSNEKATFDHSGKEVYNKNGVKIIEKGIFDDDSEYSSYVDMLLLIENTSGKNIEFDIAYESLSVNGFMTDLLLDRIDILDGQTVICLPSISKDDLEKNEITDISAIKDLEFTVEIEDEQDTMDESVVKITKE